MRNELLHFQTVKFSLDRGVEHRFHVCLDKIIYLVMAVATFVHHLDQRQGEIRVIHDTAQLLGKRVENLLRVTHLVVLTHSRCSLR